MVVEPSHAKHLSLNHVCKIGLKEKKFLYILFSEIFSNNEYMHIAHIGRSRTRPEKKKCLYIEIAWVADLHTYVRSTVYCMLKENCNIGVVI